MTNRDDFHDLSMPSQLDGPPGADGDVDLPHDDDGQAPPKQPAASSKPGVDAFVDNTGALLRRSSDVLPYVWIAIVIVGLVPVMWKLAQGYDPLNPFSFEFGWSIFIVELLCQIAALTLLAASFPVAKACLLSDDDHVRTLDGGTDILFDHLLTALPLAIAYYLAVMIGLMACILPGLFAALFLLPALYMGTASKESIFRSFLKAPGQISAHSTLYAIVVVGYMVALFLISLAIGLAFTSLVPGGDLSAAITDPLFVVAFSLGFIAVTTIQYFFYIALAGLFITTETS